MRSSLERVVYEAEFLQFTMLVANKREGADQVDPEMARTVAKQHGLGFAEVDLPSGSGVEECFRKLVLHINQ